MNRELELCGPRQGIGTEHGACVVLRTIDTVRVGRQRVDSGQVPQRQRQMQEIGRVASAAAVGIRDVDCGFAAGY